MEWHKGDAADPGAVFKGTNRNGVKSGGRTTCTVTDAEPGRCSPSTSSTSVVPVAHWRYDIAARRRRVPGDRADLGPPPRLVHASPAGIGHGVKDRPRPTPNTSSSRCSG